MEKRYTPGSWSLEVENDPTVSSPAAIVLAPDGDDEPWHVAHICRYVGPGHDRAKANARLISAAPDLVEALEAIAIYGSDTLSGRIDGPDDREWQREAVAEMTRRAQAALAKALGPGGAA